MEQTITEQILKDIHDDLQVIISQDKERKECEMQVKSDLKVSIHAPARGATFVSSTIPTI